MSKRAMRRAYREAVAAYQDGAFDAVCYPEWSEPSRTRALARMAGCGVRGIAYTAGWNDARAGELADPISTQAWLDCLAVALKRWAFNG